MKHSNFWRDIAIVEQVRDGSTLRLRLLLGEWEHQFINIGLAGVRCPKASGREGEAAEEFGEEVSSLAHLHRYPYLTSCQAKAFVESKLLQRAVRVQLLSLPTPTAVPFSLSATTAPAPATLFIGSVSHPAGNIAEFLVSAGLGRVIDWHAGMLAAGGGMERLRAAERFV